MTQYHNTFLTRLFQVFMCLAVMTFIAVGTRASAAAPVADTPIVAKCKADLAKRLKLPVKEITLVEALATTWPDAALGMPERDKMYAQVLTPGWKITLEARNTRYLYTTGKTAIKYGGPVNAWLSSMLFVMPVENEANLNGDLYQCSLMGTNCTRLASGVSEYYPQEKGAVIIKRRTSRSGHELLLVKASEAGKETKLYAALDFGDAALNSAQDTWAGFVRPALGAAWGVVVARIGQEDAKAQMLPLPEGMRPGQIAWSGEKLMILVTKDEKTACFEITPTAEKPEWKAAPVHTFPKTRDYMLNKSETLVIEQVKENGKPSVEVARVWFTGDRNVTAKIKGLTLRGYDLLGAGFIFIWGQMDGKPAAYTVDFSTGEVIPSFRGNGRDIKPFEFAPASAP
ncbi:MAG: hypothetical protein ACYDBB_03975 [Armatimonadota bacterium]